MGGREAAAAERARLPAPAWVQVSGPAVRSLHFAVVPGPARALKDSPTLSSQHPHGLGPKCSIPKAHVSSFPAKTPPQGTLGEAPGAASALTPASELDALWAAPVPRGQTGPDCPCLQDPRDPRHPSPVTGPSQYTWTYSSRLCPEQRKVTEAASTGFRKADVRGPAAGKCRHQSWPACAAARGTTHPTSAVARGSPGGGSPAPSPCAMGTPGGRAPRGEAAVGQEGLPTSHPCTDSAPQPSSAHPVPAGGHHRKRGRWGDTNGETGTARRQTWTKKETAAERGVRG